MKSLYAMSGWIAGVLALPGITGVMGAFTFDEIQVPIWIGALMITPTLAMVLWILFGRDIFRR